MCLCCHSRRLWCFDENVRACVLPALSTTPHAYLCLQRRVLLIRFSTRCRFMHRSCPNLCIDGAAPHPLPRRRSASCIPLLRASLTLCIDAPFATCSAPRECVCIVMATSPFTSRVTPFALCTLPHRAPAAGVSRCRAASYRVFPHAAGGAELPMPP